MDKLEKEDLERRLLNVIRPFQIGAKHLTTPIQEIQIIRDNGIPVRVKVITLQDLSEDIKPEKRVSRKRINHP